MRHNTFLIILRNVLKYQIRCLEAFADGTGFAAGSVEGRVAYEFFKPKANATRSTQVEHPPELHDRKSYAFRCHRDKLTADDPSFKEDSSLVPGVAEKIYPVNALAFHRK